AKFSKDFRLLRSKNMTKSTQGWGQRIGRVLVVLGIGLLPTVLSDHALAQAKAPVPSGKLVDVMALDVAGVRLGMSVKDVVAALKNNFKDDGGKVEVDKLPSTSPLLPAGKTYIERVQYLKDGAAVVQVYFVIGLPVNEVQPEVASSVSYSVGS